MLEYATQLYKSSSSTYFLNFSKSVAQNISPEAFIWALPREMTGFKFIPSLVHLMDKLRLTLLFGLYQFGRKKTFAQLLNEAHINYTSAQELEAANALESLGLIESVTYALPVEIRAELSSYGKEYVEALQKETSRQDHFKPNRKK